MQYTDKRFGRLRSNYTQPWQRELRDTANTDTESNTLTEPSPAYVHVHAHIYAEYINTEGKSERNWCQHAQTQYLFFSHINKHTQSSEKSWDRWNPNHSKTCWIFHNVFTGLSGASEKCSVSVCVCICTDLNCIHVCRRFHFLHLCVCARMHVCVAAVTGHCYDWLSRQRSLESLRPVATVSSSGLSDAPESRQVTWWFWQGGEQDWKEIDILHKLEKWKSKWKCYL